MPLGRAMDLKGHKYNRLLVLEYKDRWGGENRTRWKCKCDCGNIAYVLGKELRSGGTKSCGCLHADVMPEHNRKHKTTHGMSDTRIYNIWNKMVERCTLIGGTKYDEYGGKGIKVHEEWRDNFVSFYEWSMDNGYEDKLTIDRIDNDGDYTPNNCRWVGWNTQARNRSNTILYEYNGVNKPLIEWAEILGIKSDTLYSRYKNGLRGKELLRVIDMRTNGKRLVSKEKHNKGDTNEN